MNVIADPKNISTLIGLEHKIFAIFHISHVSYFSTFKNISRNNCENFSFCFDNFSPLRVSFFKALFEYSFSKSSFECSTFEKQKNAEHNNRQNQNKQKMDIKDFFG